MNAILVILGAVVNSLWQALAVAILVWLVLKFAPRINAATRHAIWWATLGVVLILPAAPQLIRMMRSHPQPVAVKVVKAPAAAAAPITAEPVIVTIAPGRTATWPIAIFAVWAAILLWRMFQIVRSYFYLRGVKRRAAVSPVPLPAIARHVDLLISGDIVSPMAVGFLRPAIVLPDTLLAELSEPERDHVLLHESAHLAKYDDWSNLVMRVMGSVSALHPVAIWILWRIEREREMACDDWVVARTGSARPYAASLARLVELRQARSGEMLASGIFGSGSRGFESRLGDRIEGLLRRGRTFSPRASIIGVAASAIVLCALMLGGSLAPRWIAFAQTAGRPAFEVASVKLWRNETGGGPARIDPQGIDIRGGRLSEIIADAYQIPYSRISPPSNAGSSDAWNARYEIAARADHSVSKEQLMLMVRTLLEDRFKLALHHEPKIVPVFKLVIGKNGPKLQESATEGPPGGALGPDGITIRNTELWRFCAMLSGRMGRPVVDLTGLRGSYDFTLRLDVLEGVSTSDPDNKLKVVDWSSSSIYSDIQKQLGLRLEADKAPVDYLVIDHVEKPDAN